MKLDPTVMRSMNAQDYRVLEAIEKGMKNHALVPLPLISSMANLRHGGSHKIVANLLRDKLVSHETKRQTNVDGYRLTNAGYDILALHNLKQRQIVAAFGQRIGTGKESDIYLAVNPQGQQMVLKFHRLGRTSFRNVRKKRDYFNNASKQQQCQAHSWLFLSRLSALKEYAFLKALFDVDYPTPVPLGHNRHVVAMSLVRGMPLYQIYASQLSVEQAQSIYEQAIELMVRLSSVHGLVHCDLNEFNLLVDLSGIQARVATAADEDPYVRHSGQSVAGEKSIGALSKPSFWRDQQHQSHSHVQSKTVGQSQQDSENDEASVEPLAYLSNGQPKPIITLIDFPQMISIQHTNAQELYERDLNGLKRFFQVKLQCQIGDESAIDASWEAVMRRMTTMGSDASSDKNELSVQLDAQVRASGYYSPQLTRDLELYYYESGPRPIASAIQEDELEEDEDEESGSESENDDSEVDSADDESKKLRDVGGEADQAAETAEQERPINDSSDESESGDDECDVNLVDLSVFDDEKRLELESRAKVVVQKQIETQKRKSRKHGAFRKHNSNKRFIKGKRIYTESF